MTPPTPGQSLLPELTDEKLIELRMIYQNAQPTRKGAQASTHNGLRAVYQHLRELATLPAQTVLAAAGGDGQPPAQTVTGAPPEPGEGPWDVLVQRRTGDDWRPVGQLVEAIAALCLAFEEPDGGFGDIRFADRRSGQLLVQRLPLHDAIALHAGEEFYQELETTGYRVIVPPATPDTVT